jgi:hypothetical protein
VAPPTLPLRAVAALFLERQHLARPRAKGLTAARLVRFAEDVGGVQLDSINVLDRAHYVTLWSRFGPYDRAALDRLVYRRRVLFEYWAHAACLVSTGELASWRRAMLDYSRRHRAWGAWLQENREVIERVEAAIRERGPLGSADFEQPREAGAGQGWWSWKPTTHALDFLWMSGRTLTCSRAAFQKRFDLAERVLPQIAHVEPLDAAAFRRWHLRRSLRAMGAATEVDLRMYLTFPRVEAAERKAELAAMLKDGEAVEVAVVGAPEGGRPARWFALADDVAALEAAAGKRAPSRGTTLLTPFDSFLWHRERTERLFGFDYTIEVYTPGPKRTYGYYSLPILHDGRLVGRLDPKAHRGERRLEVRSLHLEPWFAAGEAPPNGARPLERDAAFAGIAGALRSLAEFVGADDVDLGRVAPARWRAPIARALRV